MHGCEHTVGSYSHNSSFAGYCYLLEKLALCLVIYILSALHCFKGTVSHVSLFVKQCQSQCYESFLWPSLPFFHLKLPKRNKSPNLNSHLTALCFCSAPTCLIHMNGSPDRYGDARMKIEKICRRDLVAMSVLYNQIQFTTDDRTLKFCIKHLSLMICETQ